MNAEQGPFLRITRKCQAPTDRAANLFHDCKLLRIHQQGKRWTSRLMSKPFSGRSLGLIRSLFQRESVLHRESVLSE